MNPFLGVVFHWLGGLASGSFYVPYKGVKKWSWETYWLVGGFFSWIICPSLLASILTKDLWGSIGQQSMTTLWWTYFFGAMWGFGGLTFGLTMRYLGMSLGMGVALGYCAAFGTLLPPIFKAFIPSIPVPETLAQIASTTPGQITLVGVTVTLLGIGVAALAGLTKEREMPEAEKKKAISEFSFKKGIIVATFSGIMSACFAFALTAGNPIGEASLKAGTDPIWTGLPKLVVVLLGGFTTNFVWCVILNIRNRTGYQYLAAHVRPEHAGLTASGGEGASSSSATPRAAVAEADLRVPRFGNFFFSALAGTTWYFQFFFYTMGETQMGKFGFASWTLHMASIIIFSTMWGWIFHEWKGSSRKAHTLIGLGIATLILSTIIIGYGTYLKAGH
ncbi:L-rhamnose/proton symporter RhaT [Opitutus sp. ER46]|uniref:L-rhamnose/proton symporter RhaT n=1 Tax=Opitutus sp. ER46 TaxID=2161864 RepID=UPI000D316467|nr:L-rhamnose/proton symporter RhaT [Opitutus sp. ER46]PTX92472.1 L-rhamnose/proton symporter RhaT [Opitutus sp. ER46]